MNKQPFNKNAVQELLYRHGEHALKGKATEASPTEVRRAGIKSLGKRMLAAGAFSTALIAATSGGSAAGEKPEKAQVKPVEYTVEQGDTLWGIADRYTDPNSEIRDDVDALAKQTKAGKSMVQPGDTLLLTGEMAENYRAQEQATNTQEGKQ